MRKQMKYWEKNEKIGTNSEWSKQSQERKKNNKIYMEKSEKGKNHIVTPHQKIHHEEIWQGIV